MPSNKSNPGQRTFAAFGSTPAMPDGYCSGDKPNPNLRRFVEGHARPYDPDTDDYDVPGFDQPIRQTMTTVLHGKVHGKLIEMDRDLGVPDGQDVELTVRVLPAPSVSEAWGEGLRRCAVALADIPGAGSRHEQILRERKAARFREVPE
jgi:hypothetical protein